MEIFRFDTIDSTFAEAGRRMKELGSGAYLFTAREQTAGKGQGTHTFYSPRDNGIYATLLLVGDYADVCAPSFSSKLGPFATLTITEAVLDACSDFDQRLGIKWVNDLLLDGKKYGGVLTAVTVKEGKLTTIRIGFGINTGYADMPDELRGRVKTLGLDPDDTEKLMIEIADRLCNHLPEVKEDELYRDYVKYCTTPGRSIMLPDGRCGTVISVASDFSLIFSVEGKRPEFTNTTAGLIIL
jgi:BirA family biotin operon repressor/biotin-[acetyl-CoA-carboxylase] ligase